MMCSENCTTGLVQFLLVCVILIGGVLSIVIIRIKVFVNIGLFYNIVMNLFLCLAIYVILVLCLEET